MTTVSQEKELKPASLGRQLQGLVRAARPHQWIKNLACCAGIIFAGRLFDLRSEWMALIAFMTFCLSASAVYLFNDVIDRKRDRASATKRNRPIASGEVSLPMALSASGLLAGIALLLASLLPPICVALLGVYLVMNVAYSIRLKHTVLLDVAIIAIGFVIRVLHGVYAVEVKPTSWVVLCMFYLALFLGFAKRRGELATAGDDDPLRRPVLAKYRLPYLDILLAMTGTMAVLCYSLYSVTRYEGNASLVVTVPLVTYGVIRYMLLVMVYGEGESPERLLVTDKMLVATSIAWVALCVAILYTNVNLFAH